VLSVPAYHHRAQLHIYLNWHDKIPDETLWRRLEQDESGTNSQLLLYNLPIVRHISLDAYCREPAHMHTETGFTMLTAMGEITRDVIETVADRPGDSPARRLTRQQTTASTIMSFLPRDPVETMLAGQCVIFDHLLRDGAHDTLRGQQQEIKLRARPQILATGKMFLAHLDRLAQMRTRLSDRFAVQPPVAQAASPAAEGSAQGDAASSADPDPTIPPDHAEPVAPASRAVTAGAASHTTVASPPDVGSPAQVEATVDVPVAGNAAAAAPPAEPAPRAHEDPPATTAATEPAVSQAVVAQTITHSPQPAAASQNGGPISYARPNGLPDRPKPALHLELRPGVGQCDAPAALHSSLGVSALTGPGGQTSPERQRSATVRA
jgi:hypothetical protein